MIWGSGGSKSRLAKAAGTEPAGQMRDEKLHAVVARSTFPSQNVQNTSASDHFWKLRCRKSARRFGAKQIFSSQNVQNTLVGPLLEVAMSKKCTPLWREAHFEVKMFKTLGVRTTFGGWDVEKVDALVARSTFQSENVQNTRASDHFWRFRSRFAFHTTLQYITLHYNYNYNYTSRHSTTLHSTTLHCTQLHYTTLHYTTLHYTTLHYTTLHYTTLPYITLHYTTFHYTTLHYTPLHFITLHYTTLHYTTLHLRLQLHSTTLNYTRLHYTTLHYIPRHSTTLHYTTLHYITLNDTALQIDR